MSDSAMSARNRLNLAAAAFIQAQGLACPDGMNEGRLNRLLELAMQHQSKRHVATYCQSKTFCFGACGKEGGEAPEGMNCGACFDRQDCRELAGMQAAAATPGGGDAGGRDGNTGMIILYPRGNVFIGRQLSPAANWPHDAPFRLISYDMDSARVLAEDGTLEHYRSAELLKYFRLAEEEEGEHGDRNAWIFIRHGPGEAPK